MLSVRVPHLSASAASLTSQTGTKWPCPRLCFHDFQTLIFNQLDHRLNEKSAVSIYFIPFLSKRSLGFMSHLKQDL